MKRLILFILWMAAAGFAAEPQPIPEDARWVVCIEWRRIVDGDIGALLKPHLDKPEFALTVAEVEKKLGVNMRKDIQSVLLFGTDGREVNALCAVRGNFDAAKMEPLMRGADQHKEQIYAAHNIHQWQEKGNKLPTIVCVANEHLVLLANSDAAMKQCLDTLDGKSPASKLDSEQRDETTLFFCAVRDLQNIKDLDPNAAILRQVSSLKIRADLKEKEFAVSAQAEVANEATASHVKTIADGLRSLAVLNAGDNPLVASAIEKIQIKAEGATVRLAFSVPVQAVEMLKPAVQVNIQANQKGN